MLVGLLVLTGLPALASNLGFLRDTPMSYFNDADMKLFRETLARTLSEGKDNEAHRWDNPKTKSSGEITPLKTETSPGKMCREVQIVNTAKGQTAKSVYTFCKEQGGDWKVALPGKQ